MSKPQSVYSFFGSRLHLVLADEVAEGYNRWNQAFFDAQKNHRELHGRVWDPSNEPLLMDISDEDRKHYDDVASLINQLIDINGGSLDLPEEECASDFLVKL
jgi:hypothetical protein